ncbi:protein LURP-one-related 5 [Zea mays]|nr:protein LURP-one-related 5 [Zea mays]|eukprot:XP_020406797.1 protein LURP-one-related 5 [Zea mays]
MSTRIHPSSSDAAGRARLRAAEERERERRPAVYTVWKRSSMGFQGTDGFCVYDDAGGLAFRVDNYSRRRKLCAGELLLMDGTGTPLLSLRPQLLSLHDRWNCYTATEDAAVDKKTTSPAQQQVFTMSRCSALRSSDDAEVHMAGSAAAAASSSSLSCKRPQAVAAAAPGYRVEGSFSGRSCKIRRGSDGREAARVTRKSAGVASRPAATLGDDVFSLVVQPGVDVATVMAIVVVMDRICRRRPYTPMVCSSSSQ